MKRLSAALFLVIGLGCCGDTSPAGPRTVEFVRPEGASSYLFGFRAHQSASGEITGYIVSRSGPDYSAPYIVEGRVTCIRVVGHRAAIGGELQQLLAEDISEASEERGWVFYVEDNRDHPGTPDRMSKHIYVSKDPITNCPTPAADSATEAVSGGDVLVSIRK
jgi:hypothetical protein